MVTTIFHYLLISSLIFFLLGKAKYVFIGLPQDLQIPDSMDVPCGTDYFSLCCKSMEGLARLYGRYPDADWYYKVREVKEVL